MQDTDKSREKWYSNPYSAEFTRENIDGSVQDCSNSTANALELLQSCTKPSICFACLSYLIKEWLTCLMQSMPSIAAAALPMPQATAAAVKVLA